MCLKKQVVEFYSRADTVNRYEDVRYGDKAGRYMHEKELKLVKRELSKRINKGGNHYGCWRRYWQNNVRASKNEF